MNKIPMSENLFTKPCMQAERAGRAFERAAVVQQHHLHDNSSAAQNYVQSFRSYREQAPERAAYVLRLAIKHYAIDMKFEAAKHESALATLYKEKLYDDQEAVYAYRRAAKLYGKDNIK
jgi:SOS response regulatory protein OraA/RecX